MYLWYEAKQQAESTRGAQKMTTRSDYLHNQSRVLPKKTEDKPDKEWIWVPNNKTDFVKILPLSWKENKQRTRKQTKNREGKVQR